MQIAAKFLHKILYTKLLCKNMFYAWTYWYLLTDEVIVTINKRKWANFCSRPSEGSLGGLKGNHSNDAIWSWVIVGVDSYGPTERISVVLPQ